MGHTTPAILILLTLLGSAQTYDPRIPEEVKFKSGYINPQGRPGGFNSAMLWGIAIVDTRIPGHESANLEIDDAKLTCRVNGREIVLNDDRGKLRGGLYRRFPWFGTDAHEPMPMSISVDGAAVNMRVGTRPDKVWHFWSGSPRAEIPRGNFQGCTVTVRVKIPIGALLQIGMDYWRDASVGYGAGGNNHEAGASNWYFPSPDWQTASFSDAKPTARLIAPR